MCSINWTKSRGHILFYKILSKRSPWALKVEELCLFYCKDTPNSLGGMRLLPFRYTVMWHRHKTITAILHQKAKGIFHNSLNFWPKSCPEECPEICLRKCPEIMPWKNVLKLCPEKMSWTYALAKCLEKCLQIMAWKRGQNFWPVSVRPLFQAIEMSRGQNFWPEMKFWPADE